MLLRGLAVLLYLKPLQTVNRDFGCPVPFGACSGILGVLLVDCAPLGAALVTLHTSVSVDMCPQESQSVGLGVGLRHVQ